MIDNPIDFLDAVLVHNDRFFYNDFLVADLLDPLNDWFLYSNGFYLDYFLNYRHLFNQFNGFDDLFNLDQRYFYYFLDLLDSVSKNDLLDDDFDLFKDFSVMVDRYDFLNYLRDFHYLLHYFLNLDYLLDYSVHWLISNFNMVPNLRRRQILNPLDYLLNYNLNWHHLSDLLMSVNWHYLLDNSLDLNRLLINYLLYRNYFLLYQLNISVLNLRHNFLFYHLDNSLDLNYLLDSFLNFDLFGNLFDNFHDPLEYLGDSDYSLLNRWYMHRSLHN